MREGAPIRFLALMLGGWTCLRVGMLAPGWWSETMVAAAVPSAPAARREPPAQQTRPSDIIASVRTDLGGQAITRSATRFFPPRSWRSQPPNPQLAYAGSPATAAPASPPAPRLAISMRAPPLPAIASSLPASGALALTQLPFAPPSIAARAPQSARRWSGSAWLLARGDGAAALAPGGTLGGSQAGARLLYRINGDAARPLSLSGRVYVPLRRMAGSEAALGLDWRPSAIVPIHLLVERRQRLGREGRSAFSATIYGGGSADLGRGWRLDGYAQAGVVGTRSRDAFVDGSARVSRALGPIEAGAAVWGAAQPGAARLDFGPHVTAPIQTRGATLRLSAEYRFRIMGDARPATGPALTLGVDF